MSVSRSMLILVAACFAISASDIADAQPRAYRDRVEPHWFADQSRFWYRVDLKDGAKEFIEVNASTGTRETAFDHSDVAAQMAVLLGDRKSVV